MIFVHTPTRSTISCDSKSEQAAGNIWSRYSVGGLSCLFSVHKIISSPFFKFLVEEFVDFWTECVSVRNVLNTYFGGVYFQPL